MSPQPQGATGGQSLGDQSGSSYGQNYYNTRGQQGLLMCFTTLLFYLFII